MRQWKYILLADHTPVPVEDGLEWWRWMEDADRHVTVSDMGDVHVSTVFLGIDHGWSKGGGPVLFETMVFGGSLDQEQVRYRTWEEAERGHADMVKRVRETLMEVSQ